MTSAPEAPARGRPAPVGLEAGTAPGDRRFRPDVEGLRAVAVVLVVAYHAGVGWLGGGYVGVDVFFVISGFVITGVLLRERAGSGRTSILAFYGRRARRIIPAATLVIVATVVAAYWLLGVVYGDQTATDARWTSVFLANFHFASVGTNYLSANQPPSALQNFWTLAVEEQFYLVYPTVFVLIASVRRWWTLRARLAAALGLVIAASLAFSVLQTGSNPTVAYFSPFTRAWELALGALVAVGTTWLARVPARLGALMTWVGMAAIAASALAFTPGTPYPGSAVVLPVVGTALVIAGGLRVPAGGAEVLLGRSPLQWVGRLSYSIYLWHWPVLVLAADAAGQTSLPFHRNLPWLAVALAGAIASYHLVENPIRHAPLTVFGRWTPLGLGAALVAVSLAVATVDLDAHAVSTGAAAEGVPAPGSRSAALGAVEALVAASTHTKAVPAHLLPPIGHPEVGFPLAKRCIPIPYAATTMPACDFGDPHGTRTMVLYGDSHAGMWFRAFDAVATKDRWKLVFLSKTGCPVAKLPYASPLVPGGTWTACAQWHHFAVDRINHLAPRLVVVTQEHQPAPTGRRYSGTQWRDGLVDALSDIRVPHVRIDVLGNIPTLPQGGPECLVQHPDDLPACSASWAVATPRYYLAEKEAAASIGGRYIDVMPWFCSPTVCPAIVGNYRVYLDKYHIETPYTFYLEGVLEQSLGIVPG